MECVVGVHVERVDAEVVSVEAKGLENLRGIRVSGWRWTFRIKDGDNLGVKRAANNVATPDNSEFRMCPPVLYILTFSVYFQPARANQRPPYGSLELYRTQEIVHSVVAHLAESHEAPIPVADDLIRTSLELMLDEAE